MATITTVEPVIPPDIRDVRMFGEAITWLTETAQVYSYLGTSYDQQAYASAAQAITTVARRAVNRGAHTPGQLVDQLAAASTQLRIRASLCATFDEPDAARGLDLAAADLAGLASTLRTPVFVPAQPDFAADDRPA